MEEINTELDLIEQEFFHSNVEGYWSQEDVPSVITNLNPTEGEE